MAEDPRAIEREIAQTREEMAATVEAITHKANVPARAREGLSDGVTTMRQRVRELIERSRPVAERVRREAAVRAQEAAKVAKEKGGEAAQLAKTKGGEAAQLAKEKRAEAAPMAKRIVPALQCARAWIMARLPGRANREPGAASSER